MLGLRQTFAAGERSAFLRRVWLGAGISLCVAACTGSAGKQTNADAAPDGASNDTPVGNGDAADRPYDGGGGADGDADGSGVTGQPLGTPCTQALDCTSGFCADGVCCNTACGVVCATCVGQGTVGTCVNAQLGTDPRDECPTQAPSTCGSTGMCDGTGACDKYPAGTVCKEMACTVSTLTSAFRCDGIGSCIMSTPGQSCVPFNCATDGRCLTICSGDADCVAPNSCLNGSCGKKPIGAACGGGPECNSGFCEQGVCCGTACIGTCRSCAVPGSVGTCTNVPDGLDPLGQCADQGAATCDSDGACDGKAACRLYASGTECLPPTCAGITATLPGRCDGKGVCVGGTQQACDPYACGTNGQCRAACTTTADCAGGNVCNGTICGKKVNGADCAAGTECASGSCQQGVCCGGACTGICSSCALTGTRGVCTPIGPGQDPLDQCADVGVGSCGTDGSCNGAGACRLYAAGVACSAQTCTGSTLMLAGRCDGTGNCAPGASQTCMPYVCGAASCLPSCTTTADCSAGNVCTGASCGKLPLGAACSVGPDCLSGICAQGACCQTACTATCMSCALAGTSGTCSTVPAGADPLGQCADQGAQSCGTDGACDGVGGCRLYASGTTCAAGTCTLSTYSPPRTCSGTGACQTASPIACAPYNCGANAICLASCSLDADCVAPNVCIGGQCSTKPPGTACAGGAECTSGLCQQGICCNSSCTGTCRSCALAGNLGTCTPVPAGADPLDQCTDNGVASCGTDGACDGAGGCRLYVAGSQCASATCVGVTFTPVRTCNGTGSCLAPTPSSCNPYLCGTNGACRTSCTSSGDCNPPNSCNASSCGQKSNGAVCAAPAECISGFCEQGICCGGACAGTCRSCALTGMLGTCASVPAGQDPLNQCANQGMASCGTDGSCNGSGACRLYALGTTCVASTCSGTSFTPTRTCNGSGTCQTVTPTTCGAYVCGTGGSCLTTCTMSAQCASPNVCIGSSCSLGLVALYAFDQSSGPMVLDTSGNGRNGTLVGGGSFSTGLIGNALNLAGVNGYADLPDGLLSTVRDFTAAAWVRVRTQRNWQRVFDFGNNTTVNMFLTARASTTNMLRFAITTGGNGMEQILNGTAALPTGTWAHVVVVLGSAGGTLYVDGAQVATNAALTLRPADLGNTVNNWVGRSQYAADPYFDGEIDDLRFYLRALTAAEVTVLFNQR